MMKTQSNSKKYEGQCKFCSGEISKRQVLSHFDQCPQRSLRASDKEKSLRLRIVDRYAPEFWLAVEVSSEAKFKNLDKLIRNIWVECCGHLSQFGEYGQECPTSRKIMDTLRPGDKISYLYDFGSTTELMIESLSYSSYDFKNSQAVELVGRNYLPSSACVKCGKQGTQVCTYCLYEMPAYFCDQCSASHKTQEDCYLMPLANSPRTGVCGFESMEPSDKLF